MLEMIRGGTTTFVDMYYYPDVVAGVVESCGMRAFVSATVIDQRSPDAENADDSIAKGLAFIERWNGRNARITLIFGPHATTRSMQNNCEQPATQPTKPACL